MTIEAEPPVRSSDEIFKSVCLSAQLGQQRDFLKDSRDFLEQEGLWGNLNVNYEQESIPDKPTIIVSNHFHRNPWERRSFSTVRETYRITSIITHGSLGLTQRNIIWLVKNDPPKNNLPLQQLDRKTQLASIKCHGFIPVEKGNGREVIRMSQEKLEGNLNLGIYPEGETSRRLKPHLPGFGPLLVHLKKRVDYQILPVGIFYQAGKFNLNFGKILDAEYDQAMIATDTMMAIAKLLPPKFRGEYI